MSSPQLRAIMQMRQRNKRFRARLPDLQVWSGRLRHRNVKEKEKCIGTHTETQYMPRDLKGKYFMSPVKNNSLTNFKDDWSQSGTLEFGDRSTFSEDEDSNSSITPISQKDSVAEDVCLENISTNTPVSSSKNLDDSTTPDISYPFNKSEDITQQNLNCNVTMTPDNIVEVSQGHMADDAKEKVYQVLQYGDVVWGRFTKTAWWPAIIISHSMAGIRKPRNHSHWLMWFDDYKLSEVHVSLIELITENFKDRFHAKITKTFRSAVADAVKVCAERVKLHLDSESSLLDWALSPTGMSWYASPGKGQRAFAPEKDSPWPESVQRSLQKISGLNTEPGDCDSEGSRRVDRITIIKTGLCIACVRPNRPTVCVHPLFEGELCSECKGHLMEGFYAVDTDGCSMFCVVCGGAGKLLVCDSLACGRSYCFLCMKVFLASEVIDKILDQRPWLCFLCRPYDPSSHGSLHPRADWHQKVIHFFQASNIPTCDLSNTTILRKRPIRVLSLFDGIGTGKVVLDQLGIDVEVYYAAEIDHSAVLVTTYNHGTSVTHVGNAFNLTNPAKLKKLCPIDLVLGGPPCNDFSLANPKRRGLNGSGMLVVVFHQIVTQLQGLCRQTNHVFWMMENTAAMTLSFKHILCQLLQSPPAVWDAKDFSAQHRARFFWGNIPGLYCPAELSALLEQPLTLDSVLSENFQRTAVVPQMRTVTTRTNSLKVGEKQTQLPVMMNGREDGIWISELERLFGFPAHYTDVGNLPIAKRHQLLGKAWSVPVIKHLLSPLKQLVR